MAAKKPEYRYDAEEHHRLAIRAALQSTVLLKNEVQVFIARNRVEEGVASQFHAVGQQIFTRLS